MARNQGNTGGHSQPPNKPKPKPKQKLQAPAVYGPEPLMVKPLEAARLIGVGKNVFYRLMASGEIRTIKLGHSRLVPVSELRGWISRQLEEQGGDAA